MESLLFIVEKKVNILNYTLHFLWKQNLCGCRTLRDFWLLLVEETARLTRSPFTRDRCVPGRARSQDSAQKSLSCINNVLQCKPR